MSLRAPAVRLAPDAVAADRCRDAVPTGRPERGLVKPPAVVSPAAAGGRLSVLVISASRLDGPCGRGA